MMPDSITQANGDSDYISEPDIEEILADLQKSFYKFGEELLYPVKPSMCRRAQWHDYRRKSTYMITLVKSNHIAPLSQIICQNPASKNINAYARISAAGRIVEDILRGSRLVHPAFEVWRYIIMPDHVHFLLAVKDDLPREVGHYIGKMKGLCSLKMDDKDGRPFFQQNFHDRIIMGDDQLRTVKNYILDNPRRLWIKMHNPQFFIKTSKISINEEVFELRGNRFMLDDFNKIAVKISHSYTKDELYKHKRSWLRCIENGGVLVSPFISRAEKKVRNYAIREGGRVILIHDNGFAPKSKPPGAYFDLCYEGRLLEVAPLEYDQRKDSITRAEALHLNDIARHIAEGNYKLLD